MTLTDLFTLYRSKRLRGASANTIRLYDCTIRSFGKTLGRAPTIADLNDETIETHMWKIVDAGGSPASANKDRSQLICLWRWAAERKLLDTFPDVPALKEPETVPLGWLPEEVTQLLKSAANEPGKIGDVAASTWFSALIRVCLDTGERIGAIRQLPRSAVQSDYLLVPAGLRKGRTRDRLYPINADTVETVERLLQAHCEPELFPFPYSHTYLYKRFNNVLEHAGLPIDRRSKFHRIRRTVASAVARAGGDPTAALDHASPKTTKKYLDPRIVGGVQVSDILAQYLANPFSRKKDLPQHRKSG